MSNDPKKDDGNRKQGQQQGAGRQVQGQNAGQQNKPSGSGQQPGSARRLDHDKHGADCGCGSK